MTKVPPTCGFSLIELMAVLAVVSVLAAVSVTSFSSHGSSVGDLNTGVTRLTNALMQARSEAIARNTGVQLRVIVNDPSDSSVAGRVYSLWKREENGKDFQQISPWERLPEAISLLGEASWFSPSSDRVGDNPLASSSTGNLYSGVIHRGREVEVMAIEFAPSGGIRLPKPTQAYSYILMAQTVPGISGTGLASRSQEVKEAGKSNWRQIRFSNLTGQLRVNAP